MTARNEAALSRPWYRYFWAWVVFGIPFATVVAGIATVTIASTDADRPINDGWHKEGLAVYGPDQEAEKE